MPIRFLTAGESHGPALTVIVEGLPAGVPVEVERIDRDLRRRMGGFGRGGRMQIERDGIELTAGVRFGSTLGSPVAMTIRNRDFDNWQAAMAPIGIRPDDATARGVTRPRPGHADLAGALKYGTHDARDILERASARETAARTAAGALCKELLRQTGISITSRTVAVGEVRAAESEAEELDRLLELDDDAPLRVLDPTTSGAMLGAIRRAQSRKDSVGGVFEVLAWGVPTGLGSHVHWDRRLDGKLGGAMMSIQAVKAAEVGDGIDGAARLGSDHHDPIDYDASRRKFVRPTNRAGGIEGGISNGETIRVRAYLKPLATLPLPMRSSDLVDKASFDAVRERTDTIPIVAAGVVGEAMMSLVIADEMLIKFGGDGLDELLRNLRAYEEALRAY